MGSLAAASTKAWVGSQSCWAGGRVALSAARRAALLATKAAVAEPKVTASCCMEACWRHSTVPMLAPSAMAVMETTRSVVRTCSGR